MGIVDGCQGVMKLLFFLAAALSTVWLAYGQRTLVIVSAKEDAKGLIGYLPKGG